ncbi:MAG: carbon-nitrogen hydrolase family protein [Methanobacterium sp.]
MKNNFRIGLCQMNVVDDKNSNLDKAKYMIEQAAQEGAEMVVLPEMFNCPYDINKFKTYAESCISSKSLKVVSNAAKDHGVYLVAGSIPELLDGKIYNSCFIFDRKGQILDVHRKMHLFDVDIPDIKFKESETITAGNRVTVVDTNPIKIGVAICYDIRFPELFRLMALKNSDLIIVPGAFNMTTGPAHWKTTARARAIDNQTYVAAVSPASNNDHSYVAYGHTLIVDPWGKVIGEAGSGEEIVYATIDISYLKDVREQLPLLKNRRTDIYKLIEVEKKNKTKNSSS